MQDADITTEVYMPAMMQGNIFKLWHRYGTFPHFSPTSGLAIRREVFAELTPLPEELSICADAFVTRSAICFGPLISTLAPLGGYRRHSSNNVYGNNRIDGWQFFLNNVSPLLADFYQSHGFALPCHIRLRRNSIDWKSVVDKIVKLIIRKKYIV